MEDIIEEIVGNIYDKYDQEQPSIEKVDKNIYYAKGSISIKELNSKLDLKLNENSEYYDTLGGLLIYLLGYIPTEDDESKIKYENMELDILEIKRQRIYRVRITILD